MLFLCFSDRLLVAVAGIGVNVIINRNHAIIDHAKSAYLGELALDMSGRVLKPHGHALIKVFQGAGFQELVQAARRKFTRVKLQKPAASRARSAERRARADSAADDSGPDSGSRT